VMKVGADLSLWSDTSSKPREPNHFDQIHPKNMYW
jgi:hypothetical protein